ncbi:ApeA N-terminal domain 1-containing protein [Maribacter litoralis]|uniref:Uncharacterized protein n=1 Tax=Maribacter litoralis TaxID=2059726 RepID=A0A653X7B5_9FLAO|nr:HEPN domain-containing protein [Maribacter litoralis]VXC20768.1 conserved hypothetical protein [Maribacter litoralis]
MTSKFEHKGEWKLPNDENWINGTLKFDIEQGTSLELFGTFNQPFFDRDEQKIILGKTTNGDITLINSWYSSTKTSHNGIIIGKYTPSIILEGHHFTESSEIKFSKVIFRVFNLFQWLNLTGLEVNIKNQSKSYKIEYDEIPKIEFKLRENCEGKITFDGPITTNGPYNSIELKEAAYITLEYSKSEHYELILRDISKVIGFFTIVTFEQSYPQSIVLSDDKYKRKTFSLERNKYIKCFYNHTSYNKRHRLRNRAEHLVSFEDISTEFPKIIENWYNLYEDTEEVIFLILNHFKDKYRFTNDKFIDTVRALESYHRIHFNNDRIPKDEFEKLVSNIITQVKLEEQDLNWLKQRLMGNEPNLKIRIEELVEKHSNDFIEHNVPKVNKFARITTENRNYYTHYDIRKKKNALKGKELSELTRQNRAIIISCLLNHIGIDSKYFEDGLKYNLG